MTPHDLRPDDELRDLLRRFDPPERGTAAQRAALQRRIAGDAAPVLAARSGATTAWWEFAAGWARMLIPLGVGTAAVAGAAIVWSSRVPPRAALAPLPARDTLVGVLPHDRTSRDLLDALVTPASDAGARR